jgi:catechol 2,3-dioxygenase-like lactoylglutathione lyase family enzyme
MRVTGIDHLNIGAPMEALERCVRFYVDVLGLSEGHRPPFTSRGFWLYAGNAPIVHLTEKEVDVTASAGAFNHIALACEDLESIEARLRTHGIQFTVERVPMTGQVQLFLKDPAGVELELNFDFDREAGRHTRGSRSRKKAAALPPHS